MKQRNKKQLKSHRKTNPLPTIRNTNRFSALSTDELEDNIENNIKKKI